MVGLLEFGSTQGSGVPNRDQVVVTTSGKLSTIRPPLKSTDLRCVRH